VAELDNRSQVGKGLDLLAEGLYPTVNAIMTASYGTADWPDKWAEEDSKKFRRATRSKYQKTDLQVQLRAILEQGSRFKGVISWTSNAYCSELKEARNQHAHNYPFTDALNLYCKLTSLLGPLCTQSGLLILFAAGTIVCYWLQS